MKVGDKFIWHISADESLNCEIININESKYYANRIRPDKYPEISAQSAVLLKSRNKSLLFEKNADESGIFMHS